MKLTLEQAMSLAALGSHIRYRVRLFDEQGNVAWVWKGVASCPDRVEDVAASGEADFEDLGPPGKP